MSHEQRKFTEKELALAQKLGQELAVKTRESLMNPSDATLGERILAIRKQINDLGLEIRCTRTASVNLKNPSDIEYNVDITLYFPDYPPPLVN